MDGRARIDRRERPRRPPFRLPACCHVGDVPGRRQPAGAAARGDDRGRAGGPVLVRLGWDTVTMLPRTEGMWWGTAIEAPEPAALAGFYSELLGWSIVHEERGTSIVASPQGPLYLVFQKSEEYRSPVWPPDSGDQRPMM